MFQDIIVNKAIKMYFSLNTNVNLNKKFIRRRTQQRHRSSNKILINKTSNYLMYSKYKTISKIGLILYKKFIFRSRYIYNILKNKNLYNIIKLNKRRKLNSLYIKNLDKYKNEYYNSFLKETLKK